MRLPQILNLGLKLVTVPSFRRPPKRVDLSLILPASFIDDRESYLAWCGVTDPSRSTPVHGHSRPVR